jgi:MORN repeat
MDKAFTCIQMATSESTIDILSCDRIQTCSNLHEHAHPPALMNRYEGEWRNDERHGRGTMIYCTDSSGVEEK